MSYTNYISSARAFLSKELFKIPIEHGPQEYPELIEALFKTYKSESESLKWIQSSSNENLHQEIIGVCDSITKTIDLYYDGKILEATEEFNRNIKTIHRSDRKAVEMFENENVEAQNTFYRARIISEEGKYPSSIEMFHMPFDRRFLVSTQRYSIPGFPALYLGDSAYVCWEELNRKAFRNIWISKFENVQQLRIISIERKDDAISRINKKYTEGTNDDQLIARDLIKYILMFPIYAACSVKVKEPHGNFKPEYIIPQLLLQYCSSETEEKVDGIKFPSTKVNYEYLKEIPAYNYVFPVKTKEKIGHCSELKKTFKLTDPTCIELEMLKHNPKSSPTLDNFSTAIKFSGKTIRFGNKEIFYENTEFNRLENSLNEFDLKQID